MATNQKNNLFAPPTPQELQQPDVFASPKPEELQMQKDMFAPPTQEEVTPTGFEGSLSGSDFENIAKKYNLDAGELRSLAPYYGAKVEPQGLAEGVGIGLKSAVGLGLRTAALGIPQFAYKKIQDPKTRAALDELQSIADKQRSGIETAVEVVAPGGLGGAVSQAGRLAKAAGMGAIIGTTGSREGEGLKSAITGGTIGLGLGAGGEVLGKLLSRAGAGAAEKEVASRSQFDLTSEAEKVAQKTQQSEKIIQDSGLSRQTELPPDQARQFVEEQTSPQFVKDLEDKQSALHNTYVSSRMKEAEGRMGLSSKMSSLEREKEYINKQLRKLPQEANGVPFEKDLIRVDNAIKNVRKELDDITSEYTSLSDNIRFEGDTPSLGKRVAGKMESLNNLKEQKLKELQELRDSREMLKLNVKESPGIGREVSKLQNRLAQIDEEFASTFGKVENIKVPKKSTTTVFQDAAKDIIEIRAVDFAEDLLGKRPGSYEEAIGAIKELTSRQGKEAIATRYKQFVEYKQAERAIQELGLVSTNTPNAIGKAANFASDNQFVMRGLDQKYGTKLEPTLRELNKDYNRGTFPLRSFKEKLGAIFSGARKSGVDKSVVESDRIYQALDIGNLAGLTKQEAEVASGFKQYFKDALDFVNKKVREQDSRIAPLSIPQRETYVPKMMKQSDELIPIVEKKIEEAEKILGKNLPSLSSGDLAILAKEEGPVKELLRAATLLDNKPVQTGAELSARLKEMLYSRKGNIALETKARAALERNDVIPDFLLEKNLYKLANKYVDNTLKHLYLRNGIDKLRYQARALDKAGAEAEARYVRNLVQDLMGVREGTFAEATMQTRIKLNRGLDAAIERAGGKQTLRGGALTGLKALPELLEEATRQIYPNVLGYGAIRPVVQNMTQIVTKTAPELGTKYGYATVLRTAASIAKNRDLPRLINKARQLGNVPEEFTRAGERAISEGIRRTSLYSIPAEALAGMAKFGMKLFTKAEEVNRALVVGVAETMAKDLSKGSKWAVQSLRKMPATLQKEISRNPERADELLSKYLNDATMYNYNRVSMSEYGRTMGPLFSAFSKWPTATVGEVLNEIKDKGILKGMGRNWEKFVTPFLLLQLFDSLALNEENIATQQLGIDQKGTSDVGKKLTGSYGLSQSAPIGSIGGVLKGEIFTPPAVDAFLQTAVTPILEGDPMQIERGAGSAAMNFIPGAGIMRFIFDDLVTYFSGERPEGNNPAARVLEGIERVNK